MTIIVELNSISIPSTWKKLSSWGNDSACFVPNSSIEKTNKSLYKLLDLKYISFERNSSIALRQMEQY